MIDLDMFENDINRMEPSLLELKYPQTEFIFEDSSDLHALQPGEIWCCDGGSGEVTPILRATGGSRYSISESSGFPTRCWVQRGYVSPNRGPDGRHYQVYPYLDPDYVSNITHVMLDLETMDVGPTAAVIEIAAQFFDPLTGQLGASFQEMVDLKSCTQIGMTTDPGTIMWWLQQSEEARVRYKNNHKDQHINDALLKLTKFLQRHCPDKKKLFIWGNGKEFDCEILKNAYKAALGFDTPWDFRNTVDVRTVVTLGDLLNTQNFKNSELFEGVYHDPIADARHQIKYVVKYIQKFNR